MIFIGAKRCTPCPAGSYCPVSETGVTRPILCEAGFYSDFLGAISCRPCPIGTYSDKIGEQLPSTFIF